MRNHISCDVLDKLLVTENDQMNVCFFHEVKITAQPQQCFGQKIFHLPALGFRSGKCLGFHAQIFSQICWGKGPFLKKKAPETAKIALNLTLEGLKGPQVQVGHKSCSALCGTPVQAILHQTKLTWLAGGVREGQNLAQMGLAFKPNAKLLASGPSRGP